MRALDIIAIIADGSLKKAKCLVPQTTLKILLLSPIAQGFNIQDIALSRIIAFMTFLSQIPPRFTEIILKLKQGSRLLLAKKSKAN